MNNGLRVVLHYFCMWNKEVKQTNFAPVEHPRWYSGPHKESEEARRKENKRRKELIGVSN